MVKKKFAKIMTATLVASMIMGMTVVANAEDDQSLSAQAAALAQEAVNAADAADAAQLLDDLNLQINTIVSDLEQANQLLKKAEAAYQAAVKAVDEAGSADELETAKNAAKKAYDDYKAAKDTQLYQAYLNMVGKASLIKKAYKVNENSVFGYGTESADNDYWKASRQFMILYLQYIFADKADLTITGKGGKLNANLDPYKKAAGMEEGVTADTTYGNYWVVSYTDENGNKVERYFNYHTAPEKDGNIIIVEKTWNEAVAAVEAVEGQEEVRAFVNSANTVYDETKNYNGVSKTLDNGTEEDVTDDTIYAATGLADDSKDNLDDFKAGLTYETREWYDLDHSDYIQQTVTGEPTNKTTELSIEEREFAEGTYVDHSDNFGGWFSWGTAGKVKEAVNEWLEKDEFNSATVKYEIKILGIPVGEETVNINSISDWDKFWANLGVSISGCKFNVEFKSTGHHTEKVIVEKIYADVKVETVKYSYEHTGFFKWEYVGSDPSYESKNVLIKTNVYTADEYTNKITQAYVEAVEGKAAIPAHWTEVAFAYSADYAATANEITSELARLDKAAKDASDAYDGKVEEIAGNNDAVTAAKAERDSVQSSVDTINDALTRANANLGRFAVIDEGDSEDIIPDANVPANVDVITDNVNVPADDANAAPAMNANLLVAQAPVAANQAPAVENVADENVPQASAKQVENVSDEAVPQASAADESHTSWLWLIILIVAVAAGVTGYTIYKKNKVEE